ncbi:UNVERIFIED_CONTAM: hypothetical protein PYX00_009045 [Menopon gallinae]|uniref:Uncharacterized protein n=1 Tax=Menopon gallinae TaxID=328185 RepID=A0AAW2H9V7_9NEOP
MGNCSPRTERESSKPSSGSSGRRNWHRQNRRSTSISGNSCRSWRGTVRPRPTMSGRRSWPPESTRPS